MHATLVHRLTPNREGPVDMLEDRAVSQRGEGRLEKRGGKNCEKFSEEKSQVLQPRMGRDRLGRSSAETALGAAEHGPELCPSQTDSLLGCISRGTARRPREGIILP